MSSFSESLRANGKPKSVTANPIKGIGENFEIM